jgi:hypothetical protein
LTIADDIIKRADQLKSDRAAYESVWQDIAGFVMPYNTAELLSGYSNGPSRINPLRVAEVYDTTALTGLRRIAAGIESLITPAGEHWHDNVVDDPLAGEVPQAWEKWLEEFRNFQFKARYNPKTGFTVANQQALRQAITFGVGLYKVLDAGGLDHKRPFAYRSIPIGGAYLAVNEEGQLDTVYERRWLTARQIMQRWGGEASAKVKEAADNVSKKDNRFEILLAVQPRAEVGSRAGGETNRNSEYAAYVIEVETKTVLEDSGYYTFPYVDYAWEREPGQAYSVSPMMLALPDVKSANAISQTEMLLGQQSAMPPFALANEVPPPDLGPYAPNPGLLNERGELLARPIMPQANPQHVAKSLERRQGNIRDALFLNLFQALRDDPQKTATQALIEAEEKGQLLGPVASNIQGGLARLVDREVDILDRRGAFDGTSKLAPPEDFLGVGFKPEFQGPLVRARRASELQGIQQTMEMIAPLAEQKPEIMMTFDFEKLVKVVAEINGAPKSIMADEEALAAQKQQAQQMQEMQQAQQGIGLVREGAEAAGASAGAVQQAGDAIPGAQALIEQLARAAGNG